MERGFGYFFSYAASFWTSHLKLAPDAALPPINQLRTLCAPNTKRFHNWSEQFCRPNCTKGKQFEMLCEDPLAVVALYGSPGLLERMLEESDLDDESLFYKDTIFRTLKLLLDHEDFERCQILLKRPRAQDVKFLFEALFCYNRKRAWEKANPEVIAGWSGLFGLVQRCTDSLAKDGVGNHVMCSAAGNGCLPLLKHLRDICEKDPVLMEQVMTPCAEPEGTTQNTAWTYHQSIARAARFNHAHVLEFLFEWPGIERHFTHRDSHGFNVFHVVAQRCCALETLALKTLALLLSHSSAGVNDETAQGDTPLNLYAFEHSVPLECVRLLLEAGGADVRGGREPMRPVHRAAVNGNGPLCELLVTVGGADPRDALCPDVGGAPRLRDGINDGGVDGGEKQRRERELLELLCGLVRG